MRVTQFRLYSFYPFSHNLPCSFSRLSEHRLSVLRVCENLNDCPSTSSAMALSMERFEIQNKLSKKTQQVKYGDRVQVNTLPRTRSAYSGYPFSLAVDRGKGRNPLSCCRLCKGGGVFPAKTKFSCFTHVCKFA